MTLDSVLRKSGLSLSLPRVLDAEVDQIQGPQFTTPVPKVVEDQLGLHLERTRVQVDFIVIDHLELPTGN